MTPQEIQNLNAQVKLLKDLQGFVRESFPTVFPIQVSQGFIGDLQSIIDNLEDMTAPELASNYRIEDITATLIRRIWKRDGVTTVPFRQCGICDSWLTYDLVDCVLFIDTSCGCTSYDERRQTNFGDILKLINMQSTYDGRIKMAKTFKLPVIDDGNETITLEPIA